MDSLTFIVATIVVVGSFGGCNAQTFEEMRTAVANILDYNYQAQSLRPVKNATDTLSVTLDLNMAAVMGFDEANGYIELSGYLTLNWSAPAYPNASYDFDELYKNTDVWKPPIILVNAVKTSDLIGSDTESKIRVNFKTLQCIWEPWIIVRSACTPDVKFYPFDKQVCTLTFSSWGYTKDQVLLQTTSPDWTKNFFAENGEWNVDKTSSSAKVERDTSLVEFSIHLSRRPVYYVINLLSPVIVLGILNVFVFLLPAESGERLGFSVTCFLAYVVLLNTIMAFLPTSAAPLSYLSYYTFVMMIFSAGMSLATIFSLRIHLKPDDATPPPYLIKICNVIRCKRFREKNKIIQVKPSPESDSGIWNKNGDMENETEVSTEEPYTYKQVGATFDVVFFLGFLTGQLFYSITYLMPVFFNAE